MFMLISMKISPLLLGIILIFSACSNENPVVVDAETRTEDPEPQLIHDKFDFEADDFNLRVQGSNSQISSNPRCFLAAVYRTIKADAAPLILVDKEHALEPTYKPEELVSLSGFPDLVIAKKGLELEEKAAEELVRLSNAAAADGISLVISSAYRSYEYQRKLFRRYADRDGEEAASRYSARAGTSQHQLGTTVDFGDISNKFADSEQGLWMEENAGRFGWSLSYPRGMEDITGYNWESWHWRWIGTDAVILQNDYFDGSQQQMLEYWNKNAPVFTGALID